MEDYLKIGYTHKPHGVKGEIKVSIEEEYFDLFEELDVFYLKMKGSFIPYFLEAVRGASGNIMKFEDVDSPEEARKIGSKEIYVKSDVVVFPEADTLESLEYAFCIGFQVVDEHSGKLGKVQEIVEYPQQEMAMMPFKGNTVFIPLHDEIIVKIDKESQVLYVNLPEGLLSL